MRGVLLRVGRGEALNFMHGRNTASVAECCASRAPLLCTSSVCRREVRGGAWRTATFTWCRNCHTSISERRESASRESVSL